MGWFSLLLSSVGLFLSLWIWLPAPIFSLLPLSVGAPEISPLLGLGNAIALLFALVGKATLPGRLALAFSVAALVLSVWPLSQLPGVIRQANQEMTAQFGQSVLSTSAPTMRPGPFSLKTLFLGISPSPNVRHQRAIPFAKSEGITLTLEVYNPPQPGKHPTVFAIYGGAWRQGQPTDNEDGHRYLAAQGYTVIALDYRHTPEHPFPAQVEDIKTALAFIKEHAEQYEVDLTRMAVLGRSAGAHLAMLLAYSKTDPPLRGVVNYYGPVDLAAAYQNPPRPDPINTRAVLNDFLGGPPAAMPSHYEQASPIHQIQPNLPPTLTLQGQRDHIVEAKYARRLTEQLRSEGNAAVLIELPWADHAFDAVFNGLSNQAALYYIERFLAMVLRR
ncbi:MAG TPA: alpha/beta hydrolase [Leptolyngbyaceae cyanobacterium]